MNIRQKLVEPSKYNIKCPYEMAPQFIVVHNTANDASADNEIQYMITNNNEVSFHFAVDDAEVVQGIPLNRNAWHAGDGGNGPGNRYGISIEICYSKSGGSRFELAEINASKFIAMKLKEKGWGIDKVKKHQDFSGKYCPHRTLDVGWDRFLNMIKAELGGAPATGLGADQWIKPNSKVKLDGVFRVDYMDIKRNLIASSVLSNGSPSEWNWIDAAPLMKCNSDGSGADINGVFHIGDYFLCNNVVAVSAITKPTAGEPNGTCSFKLGNREVNCLCDRIYEVSNV